MLTYDATQSQPSLILLSVVLQDRERTHQLVEIISASPNPWIESTVLKFVLPQDGMSQFDFFDVNGKRLFSKSGFYTAGEQELRVSRDDLNTNGFVYVRLTTGEMVSDFRMLLYN